MPKEMIHAEKLIYEYDKRDEEGNIIGAERAIDGVDIDVPQGSFVAILGHNGSGKSTLAKHMNAILVPTGGTMWVDGRDTKDPAELWNVRQTAGIARTQEGFSEQTVRRTEAESGHCGSPCDGTEMYRAG